MPVLIPPVPQGTSRVFGNGHNGIDYLSTVGTPVKAAADGTVSFEGQGSKNSWMTSLAGICILIRHGDGFTGYAHLSSTVVNIGQAVKQGQVIGYSGNTGNSTGPHLHFELLPLAPNFSNGYSGRVDPGPSFGQPNNSQGGTSMATTKDQENALSIMAVGGYPGPGYDYRFSGKPDASSNFDKMINFWKGESEKDNGLKSRLASAEKAMNDTRIERDQIAGERDQARQQLAAAADEMEKLRQQLADRPEDTNAEEKKVTALRDALKAVLETK